MREVTTEITKAELFQVLKLMGLQLMILNLLQQGNIELSRLEEQFATSSKVKGRRQLEKQIKAEQKALERLSTQFSLNNSALTGLIVKLEGLMLA